MLESFLIGLIFGAFGAVIYSTIRYYIDKRKKKEAYEWYLEVIKEINQKEPKQ